MSKLFLIKNPELFQGQKHLNTKADIPLKLIEFRGIICVLIVDKREFKFTTYNNAKLVEYDVDNNSVNITLKKGEYSLNVQSKCDGGLKLSAPVKGKMQRDIFESITSSITVTLKKDDVVIFSYFLKEKNQMLPHI